MSEKKGQELQAFLEELEDLREEQQVVGSSDIFFFCFRGANVKENIIFVATAAGCAPPAGMPPFLGLLGVPASGNKQGTALFCLPNGEDAQVGAFFLFSLCSSAGIAHTCMRRILTSSTARTHLHTFPRTPAPIHLGMT